MELVPIIYSSLLVVISLLSIVLIVSLLCSKVFKCGNSNVRNRVKIEPIVENKKIATEQYERKVTKNIVKEHVSEMPSLAKVHVDKDLVSRNKVRVVSKAENFHRESRNYDAKPISRYMIVNSFPIENRANSSIYSKFSKISIEYSKG